MKRVILDTNVYGFLFKEPDLDDLKIRLASNQGVIIYGYLPIRRELRNMTQNTKLAKKIRNALLTLYDSLTNERILGQSLHIVSLAKEYHKAYKRNGGVYGWDTNIRFDFMLVACASINDLDVVVSADRRTLLSENAIKAYRSINGSKGLVTPCFLDYSDLIEKLRTHLSL